jgi:hypothetical protein
MRRSDSLKRRMDAEEVLERCFKRELCSCNSREGATTYYCPYGGCTVYRCVRCGGVLTVSPSYCELDAGDEAPRGSAKEEET